MTSGHIQNCSNSETICLSFSWYPETIQRLTKGSCEAAYLVRAPQQKTAAQPSVTARKQTHFHVPFHLKFQVEIPVGLLNNNEAVKCSQVIWEDCVLGSSGFNTKKKKRFCIDHETFFFGVVVDKKRFQV